MGSVGAYGQGHLPVMDVRLGDVTITVLRDTGCDGVNIRMDFVDTSHLTGRNQKLVLMDRSIMEVPVARCFIDTLVFTGELEALCLQFGCQKYT